MPSKNTVKAYSPFTNYHIYNRGVDRMTIFLDEYDYSVFLNLLKRYLDEKPTKDNKGREYPWLKDDIELLAFCLMPNHFHLLIHQLEDAQAIRKLMQGLMTSYTIYFNKRHKRVGPLLQGRYKASLIESDPYLLHISRYIHMNPEDYESWNFSSLPYYLGNREADWINPENILKLYPKGKYLQFLKDFEEERKLNKELRNMLEENM